MTVLVNSVVQSVRTLSAKTISRKFPAKPNFATTRATGNTNASPGLSLPFRRLNVSEASSRADIKTFSTMDSTDHVPSVSADIFRATSLKLVNYNREDFSKCFEIRDDVVEPAGPGEVVLEVLVGGVNQSDVKEAWGLMPHVKPPITTGRDFCGRVIDGPSDMIGKIVFGTGGDLGYTVSGSHASVMKVPLAACAIKPDNMSIVNAGTLGVPFVTAYGSLFYKAHLKQGETVLVFGANGMVGKATLELARWRGAKTIAVVRRHVDNVEADLVVDLSTQDLKEVVMDWTHGKGCQVCVDPVGFSKHAVDILGKEGRLVALAAPAPTTTADFHIFDFYRKELIMYGLNTLSLDANACGGMLRDMVDGFHHGSLKAPAVYEEEYHLSKAHEAFKKVKDGASKRVAILPNGRDVFTKSNILM